MEKMTFKNWLDYFIANQNHFDHLDWAIADRLNENEIRIIKSSIQQFQKGENSEGKNLMRHAYRFNNTDYSEVIKYFIREEQRHAHVLGQLMRINKIEKIKNHWVDDVFRLLRKPASLENSIVVLITAEIIAAVYYRSLRESTNSEILKKICDRILCDEEMHINFQSFTLNEFYGRRSSAGKKFIRIFHKILMTGTTMVVWTYHKRVLKQGGYNFKSYYKAIFEEFNRSDRMIKGCEEITIKISTPELV